MAGYVFDLETNGLLDTLRKKIHCLVLLDLSTDELLRFSDSPLAGLPPVSEGVRLLEEAELIVGHNILCFDLPFLLEVFPGFSPRGEVRDTLILSRLIWPEIKDMIDFPLYRKKKVEAGKWMGQHRLEAWGIRFGFPKGDYAEEMKARGLDPWAAWNPEMQTYCDQDVRLTAKLWRKIEEKQVSPLAIQIEHDFQRVIFLQEQAGVPFDVDAAHKLHVKLSGRRLELARQLGEVFPPWYRKGKPFTPKSDNQRYGYRAGCPMTKVVLTEFNPGSREHIADRLKKLRGWEPTEFTEKGQPSVSDDVLEALAKKGWTECSLLAELLMLDKRLGALAEGNKAWLKYETRGRIHGRVNTLKAVTGRCGHHSPNLAQVPKADPKVPYGHECRALFYAPEGWYQLGCDASGLELRMLGHYMAAFDGGAYAKIVLEGDIHTVNQKAAGLPTRNDAKTFIYAFLYGAGPIKLGSIVAPLASIEEQKRIGVKLMRSFLRKTPALAKLREEVGEVVRQRGHLIGIDGRKLHIRKSHAALNTLFQNAGAVAVKLATNIYYDALVNKEGLKWGTDFIQVLHVHDEFQEQFRDYVDPERVGKIAVASIQEAGRILKFRVPLDGEFKVGRNWAETH